MVRASLAFVVAVVVLVCGSAVASNDFDPKHLLTITDENVDKIKTGSWLVMFYAPWCGHCTKAKPVFADASEQAFEEGLKLKFAICDATVNKVAANAYNVTSFPWIVYASNGQWGEWQPDRTQEDFVRFPRFLSIIDKNNAGHHVQLKKASELPLIEKQLVEPQYPKINKHTFFILVGRKPYNHPVVGQDEGVAFPAAYDHASFKGLTSGAVYLCVQDEALFDRAVAAGATVDSDEKNFVLIASTETHRLGESLAITSPHHVYTGSWTKEDVVLYLKYYSLPAVHTLGPHSFATMSLRGLSVISILKETQQVEAVTAATLTLAHAYSQLEKTLPINRYNVTTVADGGKLNRNGPQLMAGDFFFIYADGTAYNEYFKQFDDSFGTEASWPQVLVIDRKADRYYYNPAVMTPDVNAALLAGATSEDQARFAEVLLGFLGGITNGSEKRRAYTYIGIVVELWQSLPVSMVTAGWGDTEIVGLIVGLVVFTIFVVTIIFGSGKSPARAGASQDKKSQ